MRAPKSEAAIRVWREDPELRIAQIADLAGCTYMTACHAIAVERARMARERQRCEGGIGPGPVPPAFSVESSKPEPSYPTRSDINEENQRSGGAKAEAVLRVYRANPDLTPKEIAKQTGVSYQHTFTVIAMEKLTKLARLRAEAEEAAELEETGANLVEVIDLKPKEWNSTAVAMAQSNACKTDAIVLRGAGLSRAWQDERLLGLFQGVVATVMGQLGALSQSKSQMEWDIRCHELILTASFCTSSVAPAARQGIFNGLRGDHYFEQVAKYIRQRVAAGPFGC